MLRYLTFINDITFISGAHKYTYWYLEKQIATGNEAYIISYQKSNFQTITYTQEILANGINLISIYKNNRPTDIVHILNEDEKQILLEIFLKIGYFDVIELSIWDSPLHLGIAEICRNYTQKLTLTEHTYYLICFKRWLYDDYDNICDISELPQKCKYCSVYRNSQAVSYQDVPNLRYQNAQALIEKYIDTIQAPSVSLQKDIQQSFPSVAGKVKKIDIEDSVVVKSSYKNEDAFQYKFGFIGRFHKYKGLVELDSVFSKVNTPRFNVLYAFSTINNSDSFSSVGDYTYEIVENINYNDVWKDFYSRVEYVIFPSIWKENYPLVCIECKKFNKKVIAHNIGGVPEIFENYENAILYDTEIELFSILQDIARKVPLQT